MNDEILLLKHQLHINYIKQVDLARYAGVSESLVSMTFRSKIESKRVVKAAKQMLAKKNADQHKKNSVVDFYLTQDACSIGQGCPCGE
ncbi:MAG: hypothetical protein HQM14_18745 [SAR324 cluster bacterium]|nr:hypothetical protein [SAR324 cluster bacterium]